MTDYQPKYTSGPCTVPVTADILGGRLIKATGAPAGDTALDVIGVAARDAKAGERVSFYDLNTGVHRLTASGVVAVGALLVADAGGKVKALAAVTTPTAGDVTGTRAVIGCAMSAAAVDGDIILVKG